MFSRRFTFLAGKVLLPDRSVAGTTPAARPERSNRDPAGSAGRSRRGLARGPILFLTLAALALAAPAAAQDKPKEAEIIYPRPVPGAAAAPVAGRTTASVSSGLLGLALVAAAAGGWLHWRQRRVAPGLAGRDARKLAIAETRSLGNRQYLVVADYDGRKFLLGVCPGRIDLLSPLDDRQPPRAP